jgi:hypothetical protein
MVFLLKQAPFIMPLMQPLSVNTCRFFIHRFIKNSLILAAVLLSAGLIADINS